MRKCFFFLAIQFFLPWWLPAAPHPTPQPPDPKEALLTENPLVCKRQIPHTASQAGPTKTGSILLHLAAHSPKHPLVASPLGREVRLEVRSKSTETPETALPPVHPPPKSPSLKSRDWRKRRPWGRALPPSGTPKTKGRMREAALNKTRRLPTCLCALPVSRLPLRLSLALCLCQRGPLYIYIYMHTGGRRTPMHCTPPGPIHRSIGESSPLTKPPDLESE